MFKPQEKGKLQIYTGDGKGKSTAAFGLAMRAAGWDGRVVIIQFQKACSCGEHKSAQKLGIEIIRCSEGRGSSPCSSPCPLFCAAYEILDEGRADILILDEVMAAIRHNCISLREALTLTDIRTENTELVMTGRNAPEELTERADLVTEMKKIKHYYDQGLPARQGIEY